MQVQSLNSLMEAADSPTKDTYRTTNMDLIIDKLRKAQDNANEYSATIDEVLVRCNALCATPT